MTRRDKADGDGGNRLIIRRRDADRLHEVAMRALLSAPRAAGALLDELRRAEIRPDDQVPANVAGLGAWVTFVRGDPSATEPERVQLVTPGEADPLSACLSVLSSLGAGLIGLQAGQSIDWPDRRGGIDHLVVLDVTWPLMSTSDQERAQPEPGDEDCGREPDPQAEGPLPSKVTPFPSRPVARRVPEDDWPPGAA